MPRGVFERTKEHLEIMKKNGFQKGHIGYKGQLGRRFSEEHKKKLSKAHKGEPTWASLHRKEMSDINKGRRPYEMTEEIKEKIRKALIGKKLSKKRRRRIGKGNKGKQFTEERRRKISEALKGRKLSEESIKKLKEIRKNQIFPLRDTLIEIKIQDFLKEMKIEFYPHKYIDIGHGYQCDIFIPSKNLVIECDGNYWHKYPVGREIDKIRTFELEEKRFNVLRLWETEIRNMNIDSFRDRLTFYEEIPQSNPSH